VLAIVGGFLAAAALGDDGSFEDVGATPSTVGAVLFWVWMIVTSVLLWRATPRSDSVASFPPSAGR
jgi:hypothetical protein